MCEKVFIIFVTNYINKLPTYLVSTKCSGRSHSRLFVLEHNSSCILGITVTAGSGLGAERPARPFRLTSVRLSVTAAGEKQTDWRYVCK